MILENNNSPIPRSELRIISEQKFPATVHPNSWDLFQDILYILSWKLISGKQNDETVVILKTQNLYVQTMYMYQVVKCYENNWIKILISLTICTEKRVEQFRNILFHFPSQNTNKDRFMIVYFYTFIIQHKNNSSIWRYMYHHMHALMVKGWKI